MHRAEPAPASAACARSGCPSTVQRNTRGVRAPLRAAREARRVLSDVRESGALTATRGITRAGITVAQASRKHASRPPVTSHQLAGHSCHSHTVVPSAHPPLHAASTAAPSARRPRCRPTGVSGKYRRSRNTSRYRRAGIPHRSIVSRPGIAHVTRRDHGSTAPASSPEGASADPTNLLTSHHRHSPATDSAADAASARKRRRR